LLLQAIYSVSVSPSGFFSVGESPFTGPDEGIDYKLQLVNWFVPPCGLPDGNNKEKMVIKMVFFYVI
jgi:hypothetical protein